MICRTDALLTDDQIRDVRTRFLRPCWRRAEYLSITGTDQTDGLYHFREPVWSKTMISIYSPIVDDSTYRMSYDLESYPGLSDNMRLYAFNLHVTGYYGGEWNMHSEQDNDRQWVTMLPQPTAAYENNNFDIVCDWRLAASIENYLCNKIKIINGRVFLSLENGPEDLYKQCQADLTIKNPD